MSTIRATRLCFDLAIVIDDPVLLDAVYFELTGDTKQSETDDHSWALAIATLVGEPVEVDIAPDHLLIGGPQIASRLSALVNATLADPALLPWLENLLPALGPWGVDALRPSMLRRNASPLTLATLCTYLGPFARPLVHLMFRHLREEKEPVVRMKWVEALASVSPNLCSVGDTNLSMLGSMVRDPLFGPELPSKYEVIAARNAVALMSSAGARGAAQLVIAYPREPHAADHPAHLIEQEILEALERMGPSASAWVPELRARPVRTAAERVLGSGYFAP